MEKLQSQSKKGRPKGKPKARKIEIVKRQRMAIELHIMGLPMRSIAVRLDVSAMQVSRDIEAVMEQNAQDTKQTVELARFVANERLDMARVAIAQRVRDGHLGAVDRWLKIEERAAKLNGLDAPQKTEISGNLGVQIGVRYDLSKLSDTELSLMEELASRALVQDAED